MKKGEATIPLHSVIILPRWLMLGATILSGSCALAGAGLIAWGLATARGHQLGGWIGAGLGCLIGGAGGVFGTLRDWQRRLPAPLVFAHLKQDAPSPFYRRVFWPALAVTILTLILGLIWGHWHWWRGFLQTGAMLAFVSGSMEAMRRHTTRQARTVFALYADGLLDAADTAAIDDARRKNPTFDGEVTAFQSIAAKVAQMTGANTEPPPIS